MMICFGNTRDNNMISSVLSFLPLLVLLLTASLSPGEYELTGGLSHSGSLSRYNPGVMERVNEWRHINGIPAGFDPYQDYDGHIALMNCRDVGKVATVHLMIESEWSGPYRFYVSDCTESEATMQWMKDNRIAGELDYETWERLGIVDGSGAWARILAID